jgi:uncharacterized membrane protein YphA (DoxX/SURF4 family)
MSDVIPFAQRTPTHSSSLPWSWLSIGLFRLAFPYFLISGLFWIFEFADKSTTLLARPFQAFWRPFVLWTEVHVFHWNSNLGLIFVRDTRYLYALLTCFLSFSVVIALAWSFADRKRTQYRKLNHFLRVFLRYLLAYLLIHYGMDKLFLLQFPAPGLARLTERFGDYSPSSLMWAFIGSSTTYTIFGGLAELLAAALLLFRRTATLGALIGFAVIFNVTLMDFSYDVGVKMLCLNILLMATYIVIPDIGRLLNFFFLNRPTQAAELIPFSLTGTKRTGAILLKAGIVLYLFIPPAVRDWHGYKNSGAGAPTPPLYGLYEVQDFSLDGISHPPLLTDPARWRYVIVDAPNTLAVRRMDDTLMEYHVHYDAAQGLIQIDTPGDSAHTSLLHAITENGSLQQLDGSIAGVPVSAKLKPIDRNSFTLVSRGFHWISESSFIH